jgi:hypothetical protein
MAPVGGGFNYMTTKYKDFFFELFKRVTGRKFLLTIIASATAYSVAIEDNTINQSEVWTIITPILAFIGVEGAADTVSRYTNIPPQDPKKQ